MTLRFPNFADDPTELVTSVQRFAKGRMALRWVARFEVLSPILGQTPAEWLAIDVTPADLELEDHEWQFDVAERTRSHDLSIEEALRTWPLGPWLGMAIAYDIPPGDDGYPAIYGSCEWHVWFANGGWCHSASVYYPFSSVRHDERWPGWLQQFVDSSTSAFGVAPVT